MKLIIAGHKRHGKDTVCELLEELSGLTWRSSSQFACSRVVYPAMAPRYATEEECFNDRGNHRKEWFDLITAYNTPDKARLGRELFAEASVYCGIRNIDELNAIRGLADMTVWVDASDRLPPEDAASCTVTASDCDYVLDNNSDFANLESEVHVMYMCALFWSDV